MPNGPVDVIIHVWFGDDPRSTGKLSVRDGRTLTADEWETAVETIQALIWTHEQYERKSEFDAS